MEVGVNGAVILRLRTGIGAGLCTGLLALCLGGLLVDLLADGVEGLLQVILLCLDVINAAGLQGFLQGRQLGLDLALFLGGNLVAELAQCLLGLEHHLVGVVAHIDFLAALLILGGILLGVLDSLVDVVLAHVGGSSDRDALLLAGAQVLRADVNDTVGINIEGDLDQRHAAGSRSADVKKEGSQALVVAGKLTLALQDVDLNAGLVISRSGEDLALLGGDGGVAVNDLGADAAQSLNAQAQRGNVEQQQTLDVALQNAALDGSADSNALIGIE